jgi:hypothetical protein
MISRLDLTQRLNVVRSVTVTTQKPLTAGSVVVTDSDVDSG